MACVAFKRNLEFDSMYASPSKRARYGRPVHSYTVKSPDRAPLFTELPRKMTPKKMSIPASVALQDFRAHRIRQQLKFDEPPPKTTDVVSKSKANEDQPLFTFSQLMLVCERRLKEQAQRIHEDYERILHEKLCEQYDTFVKFTHDQIMRGNNKPDTSPSYLT